jgi:hypothetical protein
MLSSSVLFFVLAALLYALNPCSRAVIKASIFAASIVIIPAEARAPKKMNKASNETPSVIQ